MSTHTPGPWCVHEGDIRVGPEDGFQPFGGCGCCGSPYMMADDEATQLADARLIAAAPDLLAALRGFMAIDRTFTSTCDAALAELAALPGRKGELARAVLPARAAIAKAEGKA